MSLNAKRLKLGKCSGTDAGVSLSSGSSTAALRGIVQSPPPVDVFGHNGTRLLGRYKFMDAQNGLIVWTNTAELGFKFGMFDVAAGKWWFGSDMKTIDDWLLVEDIVTKPPPSSWS